jgi:hypothetical protein
MLKTFCKLLAAQTDWHFLCKILIDIYTRFFEPVGGVHFHITFLASLLK